MEKAEAVDPNHTVSEAVDLSEEYQDAEDVNQSIKYLLQEAQSFSTAQLIKFHEIYS